MGKPAWSKLWGASEHRVKLHSEAAGSFSSLHEGQNGNAAVIINSFIVCGAFCWTAIKAHKQTYSKMFWHPPQSPLWLALIVLWCQAVACCNWFWITRCHIVPSLPTPKYLFTPPPPWLNQRGHLLHLKKHLDYHPAGRLTLKAQTEQNYMTKRRGHEILHPHSIKEGKNIFFSPFESGQMRNCPFSFPHQPEHEGMSREDSELWISREGIRSQWITFWIKHGANPCLRWRPEEIRNWRHNMHVDWWKINK